MMSIFDIGYSINKALMFLTYPSGLGVPTFGNDATCALQGFFTQFGYAAGSYNLVLSLYYYLIINRGMKKEQFAKVWEKVLHGIVIICHLSFAIIGVSIGLFNPTPGFCYIEPAPYGCKTNPDVPCRFEKTAAYFYEAFAQGWIQLAYVVIIVTNLLIWLYVRRQGKEMEKYKMRRASIEVVSDMEQKSSYARSVFIQSILYVGAFFLSWSWATIYHLVTWITGVSVPWITLLINTFLPLQGFFNAFIYARPRYIRLKKMQKHEHLGCMQLVKLVFFPDAGKGDTKTSTNANKNSSTADDSSSRPFGKSGTDSNVFRSFLNSLNRKNAAASFPAVSVTEGDREKTIRWTDSKPRENADEKEADEEEGQVNEVGTRNVGVSPAEEEKVEEGQSSDEFIESPSTPASPNT